MTAQATIRVGIHGCLGRMGRALMQSVLDDPTLVLHQAIAQPGDEELGTDVGALLGMKSQALAVTDTLSADDLDVIVDFSSPEGTLSALNFCLAQGIPLVIGTTGFTEAQRATIEAAAKDIPVVFAPNTSVGVNLISQMVSQIAKVIGEEADVEILEAHHRHKKDAPSGTALWVGEQITNALDQNLSDVAVHGREGAVGERTQSEIGFHAVRAGDIVADLTVIFGMTGERLELTHRATSRATFAKGALRAAKWLVRQSKPGFYSMQDVLS